MKKITMSGKISPHHISQRNVDVGLLCMGLFSSTRGSLTTTDAAPRFSLPECTWQTDTLGHIAWS